MCGICGIVSSDHQAHAALPAMNASLAHRGPDGDGFWSDARASLGHRRLAIIDLVSGDQPMVLGPLALVFNGEIYNFQGLRYELERLGCQFRTSSDTEVIVHAYAQWGDAALQRLDGMFALALWDQAQQRLLLARDRLGKKPLYYAALAQGGLAWASEQKALRLVPGVDTRLNDAALPAFLCYGYVPAPATWLAGVQQLLPGHALAWTASGSTIWQWWSAQNSAAQPRSQLNVAPASAELRQHMRRAVQRRLISDVPLGAFLSGGIDSSIVVAEMQALMGQPVKTFSIGFDAGSWFDESAHARTVAQHLGTEHHEFRVTPDAHALLAVLLQHYDEPFADSSALPTYLLSQLTRQHVTVALSGDGGDELFAGYQRFGANLWGQHMQRLPKRMRQALVRVGSHGARYPASHPLARAGRVLARLNLPLAEGFPRWLMHLTPEEVRASTGQSIQPAPSERFNALTAGIDDPLAAMLFYNLATYLPDDLLVKADRMSMAHGLEVRAPFLDTELVEWALRLPQRQQWRGGRGKWLLRHAYRGVLPAAILDRPKHGFGVPLDQWFREPLRDWLGDTLLQQPHLARWIPPAQLQRWCDDHWSGRRNLGHQLWSLLALETWLGQLT